MRLSLCVAEVALLFLSLSLSPLGIAGENRARINGEETLSRDDFPIDFVFGSGTSAYQVEGAAAEDGRTPSIWDSFAHSGYMDGSTGDKASDQYHKYKEDVELMEQTGLEGYRFSISWSRLIPNGRGEINQKGVEYYNNLINELLSHGIEPHVTLHHYDLPQVLEDEYGGWLSPKVVEDFMEYADVCFSEFGDRVSHWTTINEPNVATMGGYDLGTLPPKRCSKPFGNCSVGNSVTEPYIVVHHYLLAHSSAANLYKSKYQMKQKGFIGINIFLYHVLPFTNSTTDILATKRVQDFFVGWIIEPLYSGDYPETMRNIAGDKLPKFSNNQSKQLIGSFDFIGLNYYATLYVMDVPNYTPASKRDVMGDISIEFKVPNNEVFETEFHIQAFGLQGVLEYMKHNYNNPPIYIHENGYSMQQNVTLDDSPRVRHMSEHLASLLNALRNGSNTLGYFSWSFIDVFELLDGYKYTYGLYYVDFGDSELKRYPRLSAQWYSNFLKEKTETTLGKKSSIQSLFSFLARLIPIRSFKYWVNLTN